MLPKIGGFHDADFKLSEMIFPNLTRRIDTGVIRLYDYPFANRNQCGG